MNSDLIKPFITLSKNPQITLVFVIFLIVLAMFAPFVVFNAGKNIFILLVILALLFVSAFMSGWFGMIFHVLKNRCSNNPEEEIKNAHESFKSGFFGSIPQYMPSIIFYILLFSGFLYLISYVADLIFGKLDNIVMQLASFGADQDAIYNFLKTLPKESVVMLAKRSIFFYLSVLLYLLLTFYSIPALYFGKKINPLCAIKDGIVALFKKPFYSSFMFFSIVITHFLLIFIEAVSVVNEFFMFVALVLRVCFLAYVVVLIFSVYEKNFALNCNNGPDCLGENNSCN